MSRVLFAFTLVGLLTLGVAGDDKPKDKDKDKDVKKEPAKALAPHPLDSAFKGATDEREVWNGLLNNDHYKKACKAALKAKQDAEAAQKKNPNLVGPAPEQAARRAFLEALDGGK